MKAEGHSSRQSELAGWPITIESDKLGCTFYCTVAGKDSGARFARAEGATRQEAEQSALAKAGRHLALTRRFTTDASSR
jgi:hypothetical protein